MIPLRRSQIARNRCLLGNVVGSWKGVLLTQVIEVRPSDECPQVDRLQQANPGCGVPRPNHPLPRCHPSSSEPSQAPHRQQSNVRKIAYVIRKLPPKKSFTPSPQPVQTTRKPRLHSSDLVSSFSCELVGGWQASCWRARAMRAARRWRDSRSGECERSLGAAHVGRSGAGTRLQ